MSRIQRVPGSVRTTVSSETIARDELDTRMVAQPGTDRLSRTVGQELDHLVALQVDHNGLLPVASAPGPVIDAADVRCDLRRYDSGADGIEQSIGAQRHAEGHE